MGKKLLIKLHSKDNLQADWLLTNDTSTKLKRSVSCALSKIPHMKEADEIIVFIPSIQITLIHAELPSMSETKLQQAIPYMLEDQLADDISNLHFAIGRRNKDNSVSTAVISRRDLETYLSVFAEAGVRPDKLVPDVLGLPYQSNAWTMYIENDTILVRTGEQTGFSADAENINAFLVSALAERKDNKPEKIICNHSTSHVTCDIALETDDNLENYLENAEKFLSSTNFINLLQGDFKPKHKHAEFKSRWRLPAILTTLWLVALIMSNVTQYFYLKFKHHSLDQEITSLYQEAFPNSAVPDNPKASLTQELNELSPEKGAGFITLLAKTSPVLASQKGIKLQQLRFQNQQLILSIETSDSQTLSQLINSLNKQALKVKQNKVIKKSDVTTADIIVEGL